MQLECQKCVLIAELPAQWNNKVKDFLLPNAIYCHYALLPHAFTQELTATRTIC